MARKSRKALPENQIIEQKTTTYLTALYARLSIEDNGIDGESIENQITIIEQFIKQNPDLQVVERFIDNGRTGTNFERPGFQAMMDAVRGGKVNCIVVKDLSRFGRNYLETGNYLEKIFPYLGIRFISVTDHFDSLHAGKNDTLLVPLKSILHDTYAKDISKKVSTAIDIKKKSGKYLGKIPPYGYIRDTNDRYHLIVHPERAEIVRKIFQWRLEGDGPVTIAHRLNDMKIPTQFQIRYMEDHADGKPNALWHGSAVSDILKNPCYLGCIVERKGSNSLYKGKNHKMIPVSDWKLIENTHEPIVSKESFYRVQNLLEKSHIQRKRQLEENSHRQRTENILSGMVRCGICGCGVHRDSGYFKKDGTLVHYSFLCSNKYIKTGGCSSKAIFEEDLIECVFQACQTQLCLLTDMEALISDVSKGESYKTDFERLHLMAQKLENERKNLRRRRNELYADYKDGLLSEQDYEFARDQYAADFDMLEKQIGALEQERVELYEAPTVNYEWLNRLTQFYEATSLTKEMCEAMVEKIVIYEDTVRVHFTFTSEYEKAVAYLSRFARLEGGAL